MSPNPPETINHLVKNSPLKALARYVGVNKYHSKFDPKKPRDLKQIVTVLIKRGSRFLFRFLKYIVELVNHIIDSSIGFGKEHHRIYAIV